MTHFNPEVLLKRLGGNRTLFAELIEIFLEEAPVNLESIRDGYDRNDPTSVRIAGHTIKGSLSYFGIDRTIQLADQLEVLGRAGRMEGIPPMLAELEDLLRQLFDELRACESSPITR